MSHSETKNFSFAVLPYVELDGPLSIGGLTFQKYDQQIHDIGPVPTMFYGSNGEQISNPTVILFNEAQTADFTAVALRLDWAVTIFAFLVLNQRERSDRRDYTYARSETFQHELFLIQGGKESDTVRRVENGMFEIFHASTRKEFAPYYLRVVKIKAKQIESEHLTRSLEGCIEKKESVLASLKWFNLSFNHSFNFNPHIKLLYRCISFEALLELPGEGITKMFSALIKTLVLDDERLGEWAKQFYGKRSVIVHSGKSVSLAMQEKGGVKEYGSDLFFAHLVYSVALENKLLLLGMFPPTQDPLTFLPRDIRKQEIKQWLESNRTRFRKLREAKLNTLLTDHQIGDDFRSLLMSVNHNDLSPEIEEFERTLTHIKDLCVQYIDYILANEKLSEEDKKLVRGLRQKLSKIKSQENFEEFQYIYDEYVLHPISRGESTGEEWQGNFGVLNHIYPIFAIADLLSALDRIYDLCFDKKNQV